jgi:hypothetical protein
LNGLGSGDHLRVGRRRLKPEVVEDVLAVDEDDRSPEGRDAELLTVVLQLLHEGGGDVVDLQLVAAVGDEVVERGDPLAVGVQRVHRAVDLDDVVARGAARHGLDRALVLAGEVGGRRVDGQFVRGTPVGDGVGERVGRRAVVREQVDRRGFFGHLDVTGDSARVDVGSGATGAEEQGCGHEGRSRADACGTTTSVKAFLCGGRCGGTGH